MPRVAKVVSFSLDPETAKLLDELTQRGLRNKSHVIREAIKLLYNIEKKSGDGDAPSIHVHFERKNKKRDN